MLKVSDRDVEHLDSARASCTLETDALPPGSVTPVVVLHDHGRILDSLAADEPVFVVEMQPDQDARVEQLVVVGR